MSRKRRVVYRGHLPDSDRYIYCLIDPRNDEIRYVGVTYIVQKRLREHICTAANGGTSYRNNWIRKLLESSLEPEIRILEKIPGGYDWEWCEKWWIAHGRASGWRLTNVSDGGQGVPGIKISDETRRRLQAVARNRTESYRKKMSDSTKGRKFTKEHLANLTKAVRNRSWCKLNPQLVAKIKRRILDGESCPSVAADYGITGGMAWMISKGMRWKDVDADPTLIPMAA